MSQNTTTNDAQVWDKTFYELDCFAFVVSISHCAHGSYGGFNHSCQIRIEGLDCELEYAFSDAETEHKPLVDWLKNETTYDDEQCGLFVAAVRDLSFFI